jgi:hypothetical protein
MMNVAKQTGGLCILFALTLAACDSGDDTAESGNAAQAQLELVGSWTNNFDGTETITADTWDNGYSVLSVSSYDNDDNWVVIQSPADDEYTPNQYSKVVWTELEGGVAYYCTASFGLETLEEAEASPDSSDASAPLDGGCNGFPWTQLTLND